MKRNKTVYETPQIQALCVSAESGFADSGTIDSASSSYVTENPLGEI